MTEAQFTTRFHKWLKAFSSSSAVYEIKISKKDSLAFNAVKDHQVLALDVTQNQSLVHKIADEGFSQKPFDMIHLVGIKAYVVIFWYLKRGAKDFTVINIDDWLKEKDNSDRKSITFNRACAIGKLYGL